MTLPACGRAGAPLVLIGGTPGVGCAPCGGWGIGDGAVEACEGAADPGRDHPGPVVIEGWAVAVSFAVTSRECDVAVCTAGRAMTPAPPFEGLLVDEGDEVDAAPGGATVCFQKVLLMFTVLNFFGWALVGVDEAWLVEVPPPSGTRLGRAGVAGDGAAGSGAFAGGLSTAAGAASGAGSTAGASGVAGGLMSSLWPAEVDSFAGPVRDADSLFATSVDWLATGAWVSVLAIDASQDASYVLRCVDT